jgi:hypothetical protein
MTEHWDALRVHQVSLKQTPSILLEIEYDLESPVCAHLQQSTPRGRDHIDVEWHP